QSRGFDAVLLDHDSWRVKRAEWRCGLSPLQPQPSGTADGARYALKMGSFLLAHSALPRSRRFDLDRPPGFEAFDIVVVGSDEVWNLAHPWYGRYPLFFGDGIRPARLVSYAASFGSYVPEGGLGRDW